MAGTINSADLTFSYQAGEANTSYESSYVLGRWDGVGWTIEPSSPPDTSNPSFHTISINGATTIPGDWTAGPPDALPIELNSFSATLSASDDVLLEWTTVAEVNNYGFEVQRQTDGTTFQTLPNSFVPGQGTSLEPHLYSFTDSTVTPGTWYYRLRQIDLNGDFSYSSIIKVTVGVLAVKEKERPAKFRLGQNYPNPFNPATAITFDLPVASVVRLRVYDLLGQIVTTLADGIRDAGHKTAEWNAGSMASGIYLYRLEATSVADPTRSFTQVRKLVFIK